MTPREKMITILNNGQFMDYCDELCERWLDECGYEDVSEYGKVIVSSINKIYPDYHAVYQSSTKTPFGVKFILDNTLWHMYVKPVGKTNYLVEARRLQ